MITTLTEARIWDGRASDYLPSGSALRIEGERILAIGPAVPHEGHVVALAGAVLMPGLIDAHVHLELDPELGVEEQARVPAAEVQAAAASRAERMVRAGITTARDLGGGRGVALRLRAEIEAGARPGPRLLCAGQPLTTPGGHCHFWGGEAADAAAIHAVVARQLGADVDWIKVMATGGVSTKGTRTTEAQFDATELRAVVEQAAVAGRPVAAHCHGTAGIRNAATAGVRTIEHCSFAGPRGFGDDFDPEVAALLLERGAFVSPTVNANWSRFLQDERFRPMGDRMAQCLRSLHALGIPFVASTDAGIPRVAHHRLAASLPVFALLAGLDAREALVSATSGAARALGLEHDTGRLAPGLRADLIAVEGSPLDDLAALRNLRRVWARGRSVQPLEAKEME